MIKKMICFTAGAALGSFISYLITSKIVYKRTYEKAFEEANESANRKKEEWLGFYSDKIAKTDDKLKEALKIIEEYEKKVEDIDAYTIILGDILDKCQEKLIDIDEQPAVIVKETIDILTESYDINKDVVDRIKTEVFKHIKFTDAEEEGSEDGEEIEEGYDGGDFEDDLDDEDSGVDEDDGWIKDDSYYDDGIYYSPFDTDEELEEKLEEAEKLMTVEGYKKMSKNDKIYRIPYEECGSDGYLFKEINYFTEDNLVLNLTDDTEITDPEDVFGEDWLDDEKAHLKIDPIGIRNEILGVDFEITTFFMSYYDED